LYRNNDASDSEAEDGPDNRIDLPAQASLKSSSSQVMQTAIRLVELGPRLQLQLIKIEDGFCEGKVLFHEYGMIDKDVNIEV
jgi:ribosome biogenesis protein SSF1/2